MWLIWAERSIVRVFRSPPLFQDLCVDCFQDGKVKYNSTFCLARQVVVVNISCICWLQRWFITNSLADNTGGLAIKRHHNSFVLPAKWCLDFSSWRAASEMSSCSFCCRSVGPLRRQFLSTCLRRLSLRPAAQLEFVTFPSTRGDYGRTFILILYANSSVIPLPFILLAIKHPKCALSVFSVLSFSFLQTKQQRKPSLTVSSLFLNLWGRAFCFHTVKCVCRSFPLSLKGTAAMDGGKTAGF